MDKTSPSSGLMIPGERERNTLTYPQPGSVGMPSSESTPGRAPDVLMDAATILDRQREGGGAPSTRNVRKVA